MNAKKIAIDHLRSEHGCEFRMEVLKVAFLRSLHHALHETRFDGGIWGGEKFPFRRVADHDHNPGEVVPVETRTVGVKVRTMKPGEKIPPMHPPGMKR